MLFQLKYIRRNLKSLATSELEKKTTGWRRPYLLPYQTFWRQIQLQFLTPVELKHESKIYVVLLAVFYIEL